MGSPVSYQGFWVRAAASILDTGIFWIFSIISGLIILFAFDLTFGQTLLLAGINFVIYALYEIITTTKFGGTLGKLLLGVRVTDKAGKNIAYGASALRFFSKFLSMAIIMIGYLMVAWDERKQGLHDKVAKTYVIRADKDLFPHARGISIAVASLIAGGWLIFVIATFSISMALGVESAKDPISNYDDMIERCESRTFLTHDLCLTIYGKELDLTVAQDEELCSLMRSGAMECYANLAARRADPTTCEVLGLYNERRCLQQYSVQRKALDFARPQARKIEGELTAERAELGLNEDDTCVPVAKNSYSIEQKLCVRFTKVQSFERNSNGLHSFEVDIMVKRSDGVVVYEERDINIDGERVLPNNTLASFGMRYDLDDLPPGNYSITYVIYDVVSKKAFNWTGEFTLQTDPVEGQLQELEAERAYLGRLVGNECRSESGPFLRSQTVCYGFVNLRGFEPDATIYYFDTALTTLNVNGSIIGSWPHLSESPESFYTSVLNEKEMERYTYTSLKDFEGGEYIQRLTVTDPISGKSIAHDFLFNVSEGAGLYLSADGITIGFDIDDSCEGIADETFNKGEERMSCFQPINVRGFKLDERNLHQFDMELSVLDGEGNLVDFVPAGPTSEWDPEEWHYYLQNGVLNDRYVTIAIENLKPGKYDVELKVFDIVGGGVLPLHDQFTIK